MTEPGLGKTAKDTNQSVFTITATVVKLKLDGVTKTEPKQDKLPTQGLWRCPDLRKERLRRAPLLSLLPTMHFNLSPDKAYSAM